MHYWGTSKIIFCGIWQNDTDAVDNQRKTIRFVFQFAKTKILLVLKQKPFIPLIEKTYLLEVTIFWQWTFMLLFPIKLFYD